MLPNPLSSGSPRTHTPTHPHAHPHPHPHSHTQPTNHPHSQSFTQGFPAKVRSEETAAIDSDAAEARRLEDARRANINLAVAWGLVLICCRWAARKGAPRVVKEGV